MEKRKAQNLVLVLYARSISPMELRETRIWLLMITKANLIKSMSKLKPMIEENNELISIFVVSVKTSKQKEEKKTS